MIEISWKSFSLKALLESFLELVLLLRITFMNGVVIPSAPGAECSLIFFMTCFSSLNDITFSFSS